jgi:hypothetical protein
MSPRARALSNPVPSTGDVAYREAVHAALGPGLKPVSSVALPDRKPDSDTSKRPSRFDDRINPRWLRIPTAVRYSGINRSRLFRLISEGAVKSACLKEHCGAKRGLRLVDKFSLDLFLETLSKPVEERLVAESNDLLAQEQQLALQQKALEQKRQTVARELAKIRRLEPPEQ